jgi:exosortase A
VPAAAWLALAAVLLLAAAYWPTLAAIEATWRRSETFAHGYVVLPIAAWLAWRQRARLAGLDSPPWWPGLLLVAAGGGAWAVGRLADVAALGQFAAYGLLLGAAVTVLGRDRARALAFPLGFAAFAIPVGEFLVPLLIEQTARFTVRALQLTGVPVYREGNLLLVPGGRWSVVDACSGVRYLIASVMVGTLYAWIAYRSIARRLAFVALSIAMPIVANWLRAYLIVMIAHLTDNRLALGVDHFIYGWFFFGVVIAATFWIGSLWREAPAAAPTAASGAASGPAPGGTSPAAGAATAPLLLGALAALAIGLAWRPVAGVLVDRTRQPVGELAAITAVEGWQALPAPPAAWAPGYRGAAATLHQGFARDGAPVGLFVALYGEQRPGHELVGSGNALVDDEDPRWRSIGTAREAVPWGEVRIEAETSHLVGRDGTQLTVRSWYWADGRWTASRALAKARLAAARLRLAPDHTAVIVLYAPRNDDAAGAAQRLDRFGTDVAASVAQALRAASDAGRRVSTPRE